MFVFYGAPQTKELILHFFYTGLKRQKSQTKGQWKRSCNKQVKSVLTKD